MYGRQLGLFPQRLQEICLGFRDLVLKNVQALGAIGAQIRCQATQGNSLAVRLKEAVAHLAAWPHPARAHHHVAQGGSFERPRVLAFTPRALEIAQCFLKAFARAAIPAVPALPDQIVGVEGLKAVAHSRAVADPGTEFAQDLLYFPHCYRDGVLGDRCAVPGLVNHFFVTHMPPSILDQHPEHLKRLRPDVGLHAVAQQTRTRYVHAEGAKRDGFDGESHNSQPQFEAV